MILLHPNNIINFEFNLPYFNAFKGLLSFSKKF